MVRKARQEAGLSCSRSLLIGHAVFSWRDWPANPLLIQELERKETGLFSFFMYQTFWGPLPQTEAKRVGVKLITPCFPCLQASGSHQWRRAPHTSRHTLPAYLPLPYPCFSLSLTVPLPSLSLCGPYADVQLHWTEKWGFTLCKTESSEHAEC